MTTLAHVPVAAVVLHALAVRGVPAFLDLEEDFIVAHPPHLSQNQALNSEHIVINTNWEGLTSAGRVDQYPGNLYATTYEGYDGSDYCDIARVYHSPPGEDLMADAAACAKAVVDWFGSRLSTADTEDRNGADDTDEVRTSTTEVC